MLDPALRLKAGDADDLGIVSACLQDALILIRDLEFVGSENRFVAACNRFRWEHQDQPTRVVCGIVIDHVLAVQSQGIPRHDPEAFLVLLAIKIEDAEAAESRRIELCFAGGSAIRLEVARILCHVEDIGDPWPVSSRPHHD